MKTPDEWLHQQIGDRPEDFAPEDLTAARDMIAAVQADALASVLPALAHAMACDFPAEVDFRCPGCEAARAILKAGA